MKERQEGDLIQDHWRELRALIHQRWPEVGDTELDLIDGHPDTLVGVLQEHYSVTRDEARRQVREFENEHRPRLSGGPNRG